MRAKLFDKGFQRIAIGRGVYHGFTLVELLVVIGIISILAAMLLPALQSSLLEARKVSCANQLRQIGLAITEYHGDAGYYPNPARDDYLLMNGPYHAPPANPAGPCNLGWLWRGSYLKDVKIFFCTHQDMTEAWRVSSFKQNVNKIKNWQNWARAGYSTCYLTPYQVQSWNPFAYVRKSPLNTCAAYIQCTRHLSFIVPADHLMTCHKDTGVNSLALDMKVWWLPRSVYWDVDGHYFHNVQCTSHLFNEATNKRMR